MLDLKGKEAKDGSVTIDNITSNTFDFVLRYLYADELTDMTMEQAIEVALAADYLQLEDLKTVSLKSWKDSFAKIEGGGGIVAALRALITSPLHVKPDENWRKVVE